MNGISVDTNFLIHCIFLNATLHKRTLRLFHDSSRGLGLGDGGLHCKRTYSCKQTELLGPLRELLKANLQVLIKKYLIEDSKIKCRHEKCYAAS